MERKWWTLIAVSVATFMLLLDITVVNTALPSISEDLGASFTDLQWVVDAYTLSLAALVLTAGVLADRLGRRRVFAVGLGICGLAGYCRTIEHPGRSAHTSVGRRRGVAGNSPARTVDLAPARAGLPGCGLRHLACFPKMVDEQASANPDHIPRVDLRHRAGARGSRKRLVLSPLQGEGRRRLHVPPVMHREARSQTRPWPGET